MPVLASLSFGLCAARPEPIPFFGELGAVNPMFLLPAAMAACCGDAVAQGWSASLTMGAGQFCTNPGIAVVMKIRQQRLPPPPCPLCGRWPLRSC